MAFLVLAPTSGPDSRFSRLFGEEELARDHVDLLSVEFSMGTRVIEVVIPELLPDAEGQEAGWVSPTQPGSVHATAGEARAVDEFKPLRVLRVRRDRLPTFINAVECGMYLDDAQPETLCTTVRSLSDEDFPHVKMPSPEEFDPFISVIHASEALAVDACLREARKLQHLRGRLGLGGYGE